MEANYIGLILMASAGYDPRVAPQVYMKLAWSSILARRGSSPETRKTGGDEAREDSLFDHQSGDTREQQLLQPQVMEEAVSIYNEVLAQRRRGA